VFFLCYGSIDTSDPPQLVRDIEMSNLVIVGRFASVAEAVCDLIEKGYHTVYEVRLMMRDGADIMVISHLNKLDVIVEEDDGYWADKLEDLASDGVEAQKKV
jgi:hypothetical protein